MNYTAPLRDIEFVMFELFGFEEHYASLACGSEATSDVVTAILAEYARFSEQVLAPLNAVGDHEGCRWDGGDVTTAPGFRQAWDHYVESGWPSLSAGTELGGQGLPPSLDVILGELSGSANMAWHIFRIASDGAKSTLDDYGNASQRELYLRKLITGEWCSTMCLTESHCGSDLGLLKTRAEDGGDGSYRITGTKIFISCGEHDLSENIVHIVLARLPDAPPGTRGISLFLVPKLLPKPDGTPGQANSVTCGSIEEKMGIHGNPTCVMHFEDSTAYLLGEPNRGLQAMFSFMNHARLACATQGLSHAELGFQKSLFYAQDRLQMRSLSGPKNPDGPADPIIVHPDVRRMLLTQKAFAEGLRMLNHYIAQQVDLFEKSECESTSKDAGNLLDLLTPIAKAFSTEVGFESSNLAIQCFGGHGYIREWGVEQNLRDARISTIYEGTTGIQALDLLSRKVLGSEGQLLNAFIATVAAFAREQTDVELVQEFISPLLQHLEEWQEITAEVGERSLRDADEIGAASVNYLMYCGYVCLAYLWAQAAAVSKKTLQTQPEAPEFYQAKLSTARFYFSHLLPRTRTCVEVIRAGASDLMALEASHFRF